MNANNRQEALSLFRPIRKKGYVFSQDGKVGFAMPYEGEPLHADAIPFEITGDWPETDGCPAWTDLLVTGNAVRISSELVKNPYRLADSVFFAHTMRGEILSLPPNQSYKIQMAPGLPQEQSVLFFRTQMQGETVILVDTPEQMQKWNGRHEVRFIKDGQHRLKGWD
jgi:hypothetical protein